MRLEQWKPLIDIERDWELHLPRFWGEKDDFAFRPFMDVVRGEGELVVSAELPGIDADKDIEITLHDDYLTIKGEKSEDKEVTEDDRYIRERRFGSFVRTIPLPEGVSADKIAAEYTDGVLTVKVALPEESEPLEPRKIPVGSTKS